MKRDDNEKREEPGESEKSPDSESTVLFLFPTLLPSKDTPFVPFAAISHPPETLHTSSPRTTNFARTPISTTPPFSSPASFSKVSFFYDIFFFLIPRHLPTSNVAPEQPSMKFPSFTLRRWVSQLGNTAEEFTGNTAQSGRLTTLKYHAFSLHRCHPCFTFFQLVHRCQPPVQPRCLGEGKKQFSRA